VFSHLRCVGVTKACGKYGDVVGLATTRKQLSANRPAVFRWRLPKELNTFFWECFHKTIGLLVHIFLVLSRVAIKVREICYICLDIYF
jgi:hypothetical protein